MNGMPHWWNETRSDAELVREAVRYYAEGEKDREDDLGIFPNPITVFYYRCSAEAVALAGQLCRSAVPLQRRVGADILNQVVQALRDREDKEAERCLDQASQILFAMLDDGQVVHSIITALGFLKQLDRYHTAVVDALSTWYRHPHATVRRTVTHALCGATDERAVEMLRQLTADAHADVRDLATFGLGVMSEADSPAIREALAARLHDPHATTRGEALVGLARRGDSRAVERLLQMTFSPADARTLAGEALIEAGIATGDARLLPLLACLTEEPCGEDAGAPEDLVSRALATCRQRA